MSRIALTFGSFAFGVLVSFFSSHAVTLVQAVFAQSSPESQAPKAPAVNAPEAAPVVPSLSGRKLSDAHIGSDDAPQWLDGLDCTRCTIDSADLAYAGGQFNCSNCLVKSQRVAFKGAALNTVNLLRAIGFFGTSKEMTRTDGPGLEIAIGVEKRYRPLTLVSLEK